MTKIKKSFNCLLAQANFVLARKNDNSRLYKFTEKERRILKSPTEDGQGHRRILHTSQLLHDLIFFRDRILTLAFSL